MTTSFSSAYIRCQPAKATRDRRHRVRLNYDGSIEALDCPNAAAEAKKMLGFMRLGAVDVDSDGCAGLVALLDAILCGMLDPDGAGLPTSRGDSRWLRRRFSGTTGGPWKSLWEKHGGRPIIDDAQTARRSLLDKKYKPLFDAARAEIRRTKLPAGAKHCTFVPTDNIRTGWIVADFPEEQDWEIPISTTWQTDIGDLGIGYIDGAFLVTATPDPGVYIGLFRDDDHFVLRRCFVNTNNRKVQVIP